MRPGLWSQEVAGSRAPAAATTICLDESGARSGALFGAASRVAASCRREIRREGAGWRFDSVCQLGGGAQLSSTGLATGDFSSSFAVRSVTSVSGAPLAALDGQHETLLVGRWLGPCPKGMAPGDVRFADGRRLRSRRLRELASAFAGA